MFIVEVTVAQRENGVILVSQRLLAVVVVPIFVQLLDGIKMANSSPNTN